MNTQAATRRVIASNGMEIHPSLELVQDPARSTRGIRYVDPDWVNLDTLNQLIYQHLADERGFQLSTGVVDDKLVLRPGDGIGLTLWPSLDGFLGELVAAGDHVTATVCPVPEYCLIEPRRLAA